MAGPVGIGVIGAGTISDTYLENLTKFADTEVLAIGDIVPEAAQEKADKYDIPVAGDVAAVLNEPGVEIVANLTIPAAHAEVASQAIAAGLYGLEQVGLGVVQLNDTERVRSCRNDVPYR